MGTPDAGTFWRVIAQHGAVAMFTAPTAFRAIKREDPDGKLIRKYDLSKFRTLFLAGERADPPTVEWAEQQLKVPVIDHWWQTETGWADRRQLHGAGPVSGEARLADQARAGLRFAGVVARRPGDESGRDRRALRQAADAAGLRADAVERRRPLRQILSGGLSRLLPDRRCRLHRPGRLCVRHGAHRRHHQCRGPPAVHRSDRGGAGVPSRSGGMRGDRRRRRAQGPGAGGIFGAQGRRGEILRDGGRGNRQAGARPHRPGGELQDRAWWWIACPRRARERSCAAPCATSPTARTTRPRRPSTIRRS